mgnify:CR=1 FL=1
MSILEKLTEGIVNRDLRSEGAALLSKWERTGLLEGLGNDRTKHTMARLLENQAKQLLKEAAGSSMAAGDVEGFAAVAFPIVRRVFGGLIANDLVSVQPMSLPSGLIFFLDFTFGDTRLGSTDGESLFGQGVVGQEITGGVDLTGTNAEKGPYALNNGFSSATASFGIKADGTAGGLHSTKVVGYGIVGSQGDTALGLQPSQAQLDKFAQYDPDLSGSFVVAVAYTGSANMNSQTNLQDLITISATGSIKNGRLVRRLTQLSTGSTNDYNPQSANFEIIKVYELTAAQTVANAWTNGLVHAVTGGANPGFECAIKDNFGGTPSAGSADAIGAVRATTTWGLEDKEDIPEIDIKVDSVSVTAITKKLKAKWTPELGQDLNAYHNLDAEVELTSILSEQIALEIDREILKDLLVGATAGTYYWSRSPGLFVNRTTGEEVGASSAAPDFTGTVSEWYETLVETINDVSAQIHRKTLRGGANFVVCSPEVANILEFTAGFRASVTHDQDRGTIGAVNVGSLSKKFDVYVDPYFPRNVILVGRKGGSFLESGYVYAPYVPLQVTPTIFGVEDFVPRKGVMTRYAKKMVRPDMYGVVICQGLLSDQAGATS